MFDETQETFAALHSAIAPATVETVSADAIRAARPVETAPISSARREAAVAAFGDGFGEYVGSAVKVKNKPRHIESAITTRWNNLIVEANALGGVKGARHHTMNFGVSLAKAEVRVAWLESQIAALREKTTVTVAGYPALEPDPAPVVETDETPEEAVETVATVETKKEKKARKARESRAARKAA